MIKIITKSLLIGVLTITSASPAFAATGFAQRLLDAEEAKKKAEAYYQECLRNNERQHNEKNQEIARLTKDLETIVREKERSIQTLREEKQELVNQFNDKLKEISNLEKENVEKIKIANNQCIVEKNDLISRQVNETQALKRDYDLEISKIKDRNSTEIESLKKEHSNKIVTIESENTQKMQSLKQKNANDIQTLNDQHAKALDNQSKEIARYILEIQTLNDKLAAKLEEIKNSNLQCENDKKALVTTCDDEKKSLNDELATCGQTANTLEQTIKDYEKSQSLNNSNNLCNFGKTLGAFAIQKSKVKCEIRTAVKILVENELFWEYLIDLAPEKMAELIENQAQCSGSKPAELIKFAMEQAKILTQ